MCSDSWLDASQTSWQYSLRNYMSTERDYRRAQVGVVRSNEEWSAIYPHWVKILEKQPNLPVSVDPRWLSYWWGHFGSDRELSIFWAALGDDVLAILPLMRKRVGSHTILTLLSDCCSDYLGGVFSAFACDPIDRIAAAMCDHLEWDEIRLQNIRQDDVTLHIVTRALQDCGLSPVIVRAEDAPYIELGCSWDKYLKSRTRNRRRMLNRKMRALRRRGKVELQVVRDYDHETLERLFDLHDTRWDSIHGVQAFADTRRRGFIHDVAKDFAGTGNFCLFHLLLNGNIVAYRMGFIRGGRYYDWNTSFDLALDDCSPGLVLLGEAIRWACDNGLQEVDFMRGHEEYKLSWNTAVRSLYTIQCSRPREPRHPRVPVKSTDKLRDLASKRGVVLDLDGVLYKGDKPIEASLAAIRILRQSGVTVGFLTNTSVRRQQELADKLGQMAVIADPRHIMTSTIAAAEYCRTKGYRCCLVLGGAPALPELLACGGMDIAANDHTGYIDAVVVGYSKDFIYADLVAAQRAILKGAEFVCTDRDRVFAAPGMDKPGTGWIVAAIETVTGKSPFVVGKPNDFSLRLLLHLMGMKPQEVAVIGDSLDTDIAAARKAGALACLVLGGISTAEDVARRTHDSRPDLVFADLVEMVDQMRGDTR